MSTKVLVAIDRSGLPTLVPDALASQVHPQDTEILVLQVVEPILYSVPPEMSPGYAPELAARRQADQEKARKALTYAVELLTRKGFKVSSRLVEGEIKEGIIAAASEWAANLIVVTSHARHGVEKFLHRSIAEGIVHRAPCSVLVLKEQESRAAA